MYDYKIIEIDNEYKWIHLYCAYLRAPIATIDLQAQTLHLAEINPRFKARNKILIRQEQIREMYLETKLNSKDFLADIISLVVQQTDQQ